MNGFRVGHATLDEAPQLLPDRGCATRALDTKPNVLLSSPVSTKTTASPDALVIDKQGHIKDLKVTPALRPKIERGPMEKVVGIIVHQTGGSNAKGALSSYEKDNANGAHFLVDKDGTIYQTASVYKRCNHVGQLKSRCMAEQRCTPAELKALAGKGPGKGIGRVEAEKAWPNRYPGNFDSIGIEIVGTTKPATPEQRKKWQEEFVYEELTDEQQAAFAWLLRKLLATLQVQMTEVFTHPTVSWKNRSEGGSAKW
jgi:N-acetyl-anhydromuramyl-L-alanine amidase AmpD